MLRLDASKAEHLERLERKRRLAAGERKRLARDRIPDLTRLGTEVDRARPLADVAVDYGPVGALVRDIAANSECSRPTAADKDFTVIWETSDSDKTVTYEFEVEGDLSIKLTGESGEHFDNSVRFH